MVLSPEGCFGITLIVVCCTRLLWHYYSVYAVSRLPLADQLAVAQQECAAGAVVSCKWVAILERQLAEV